MELRRVSAISINYINWFLCLCAKWINPSDPIKTYRHRQMKLDKLIIELDKTEHNVGAGTKASTYKRTTKRYFFVSPLLKNSKLWQ